MATATRLLTADDVFKLPSDLRCELIDGVLIETSPPGPEHGMIAATITRLLGTHVRANRLGIVFGEAGFIVRRGPDTVRAPDAAFIRADRVPPTGPPKTFWETAPDLVVEVVSPNDTPAEVQAKIHNWIEAGVRLAWVVYPSSHRVVVVRSLQAREELTEEDVLSGEDVVPGFECPVHEIFRW